MKNYLIAFVMALVLLAGCAQYSQSPNITKNTSNASAQNKTIAEITISGFAFQPAALEIDAGTTVKWTNLDSAPHTVTTEGDLRSGTIGQRETFSYTFNEAGTYDYICSIHPSMNGKVIVK